MPKHHTDIEQLMIDQLTGEITPEDAQLLQELLATDEQIRQLWLDTSAVFHLYKAQAFAKTISVDERLQQLMYRDSAADPEPVRAAPMPERTGLTGRWHSWIGKVAVAIAVPLLIYAGWLLVRPQESTILIAGADETDSVMLVFEDGAQRALDDRHPVHVGALVLAGSHGVRDTQSMSAKLRPRQLAIRVPKGKTYQLDLPDGTRVHLNADSRLEFPDAFADHVREVHLSGEAFFDVAKDAQKPFVVQTDDMNVLVKGTSFNLKSYTGEQTQASVLTGRVSVYAPQHTPENNPIDLVPGMAAVTDSEGQLSTHVFDRQTVLGWRDGIYFFNNESLDHILVAVNRFSGLEMVIADADLAKFRFSGAYEYRKPVELLLKNLTQSSTIRYRMEGRTVTIY